MKIPARLNFMITREVEELSATLHNTCYLHSKKAKTISARLANLLKKIDSSIKTADCFSKDLLTEQKLKAIALVGRCQTLELDSQIKNLAEEAEKLLTQPKGKSKIRALKNTINKLTAKHMLSTENRKLIRFAELLLESKSINQTQSVEELLSSVNHDLALSLLEIAQYLYFYHLDSAEDLYQTIDQKTIDELNRWMSFHELSFLSAKPFKTFTEDEAKKTAQVLIAFTDHMTLYKSDKKLPSLKELDELFFPLS